MAFQSDFTKAPLQIILDLVNNFNGDAALTTSNVTAGLPTASQGANPARNTTLTLTAVDGSGYSGSVDIEYNRVDISTVPGTRTTSFPVASATGSDIASLIATVNAAYGINLTVDDYVNGPLPTFAGTANETHDVAIVMNSNSLPFIGTLTLTLTGSIIALSSVVTQPVLDGLTYVQPAG